MTAQKKYTYLKPFVQQNRRILFLYHDWHYPSGATGDWHNTNPINVVVSEKHFNKSVWAKNYRWIINYENNISWSMTMYIKLFHSNLFTVQIKESLARMHMRKLILQINFCIINTSIMPQLEAPSSLPLSQVLEVTLQVTTHKLTKQLPINSYFLSYGNCPSWLIPSTIYMIYKDNQHGHYINVVLQFVWNHDG